MSIGTGLSLYLSVVGGELGANVGSTPNQRTFIPVETPNRNYIFKPWSDPDKVIVHLGEKFGLALGNLSDPEFLRSAEVYLSGMHYDQ